MPSGKFYQKLKKKGTAGRQEKESGRIHKRNT
jgi:hypothetical protein